MDWLQFLQIVCVPAFVWLVYKFGEMRKELNEFKVQVAREYAYAGTYQPSGAEN